MLISITNAFLYVTFATLMGILVLRVVPKRCRPALLIPPYLVYLSLAGTLLLSLVPLIWQAVRIAGMFEVPFFKTLWTILTSYRLGQGGLAVVILTLGTLLFHLLARRFFWADWISLMTASGLAFAIGFSSHAASLQPAVGFMANSLHFLAAGVWAGVLLVVGFYSASHGGWLPFFRWFTPLAVLAVFTIISSGFVLMNYIVPEYVNSWMLTYGQLLLLKHLLVIPLIFYGFAHGFWVRKRLEQEPAYSPQKSIRSESVLLLVVFAVTAFMTEQTPPHEVARTLQFENPAAIARQLIGERLLPGEAVTWTGGWVAYLFLALAVVFLAVLLYMIKRQHLVAGAVPVAVLAFLLTAYAGLISGAEKGPSGEQWAYVESLEKGIAIGRAPDDQLELLLEEPYGETMKVAVYTVNRSELVAELFLQAEDGQGYYKIPEATLTIGGVPLTETDQKIRTFLIQEGLWKKPGSNYTYVTIGYIQHPANTKVVKVHYEEEVHELEVKNQAFFTAAYSQNLWSEYHPFEFFDGEGNEVGGYLREMMEVGAFCH